MSTKHVRFAYGLLLFGFAHKNMNRDKLQRIVGERASTHVAISQPIRNTFN